jgi:hypothetical protein
MINFYFNLDRAAKVCQLWHNIASQPSLWRKVDLSYGWIRPKKDTLRWLAKERLTQCTEVNLTNWALTNDQLKVTYLFHICFLSFHLSFSFYHVYSNFPVVLHSNMYRKIYTNIFTMINHISNLMSFFT